MKILKYILFVFLGFIAAILVIAAFIDGHCEYKKSITINAPVEKVWQNNSSLKAMDQWSPWNKLDPNMKKTWTGETGMAGEKDCWEGNEAAGKGCQEVTKIDVANKKIETRIQFLTPYESEATSFVTVVPEGSGSKATWAFITEVPYPWTITTLFFDMESAIGKDFQEGMENLKKISEQ